MAFEVFGPGITSIEELREKLVAEKRVHSKYKKKLAAMNEAEIKEFVFFHKLPENNFEGVATIFTAIAQKDLRKLAKYVLGISMGVPNILRIMIDTLGNIDYYKDSEMLHRHLFVFKVKYEERFKRLLLDFAMKTDMDKLDLLGVFKDLMK